MGRIDTRASEGGVEGDLRRGIWPPIEKSGEERDEMGWFLGRRISVAQVWWLNGGKDVVGCVISALRGLWVEGAEYLYSIYIYRAHVLS